MARSEICLVCAMMIRHDAGFCGAFRSCGGRILLSRIPMAFLDRSRHPTERRKGIGNRGKTARNLARCLCQNSLRSKNGAGLARLRGAIRQSDLIRREDSRFTYSRWFACGVLRR